MARDRPSAAWPHPLGEVRRAHGWSYQDLARVIAEHARALGVPMAARREKVWRWEHWGVVPEADSQRALARALDIPFRELELRPWPRWLPARGRMPDGLPWTADGARAALSALLEGSAAEPSAAADIEDETLRDAIAEWDAAPRPSRAQGCQPAADPSGGDPARGQRPAVAPASRERTCPAPGADPRVPAQAGAPGVVDAAVLEWLESGAAGLRHLAHSFGGESVLHRVDADLRVIADLLGQCPPGRSAERGLLRIAAGLAQLGGRAAADAGRHAATRDYCLTGLRLAHACGDRDLAVALWSVVCLDAVTTGRARDALAAGEAAVRAAGGGPPAVMALAASRLGRAHAALGAEGAFRRAAAEAERRLATAGGEPPPPWLSGLDAGELAVQRGLALLDLGLAAEARPLLELGLAVCDPARIRDRALYAARAARARALTGDPDGARSLAREAFRLSANCGSPHLTGVLEPLAPLLAPER
ncbi:hypothetical protein [Actinacidiphila yeochonensis]|uniref:hypothetical protein n=1 Tax=Actinacidiphila yeochonensis TaxID=89050 RepID=UPI001E633074|nr:hypothetical protein [Actinacidiphila yeochonensis]